MSEESIHGEITLANLGGGAALERFSEELEKVLENILDVNTDAKKTRSITMTVAIKPTKERNQAAVGIACTSKLAPVETYATRAFIGRHGQRLLAFEDNPQQLKLGDFIRGNAKGVATLDGAAPKGKTPHPKPSDREGSAS